MTYLPVKSLHPESSLIQSKLDYFSRLSNEDLILSFLCKLDKEIPSRRDLTGQS